MKTNKDYTLDFRHYGMVTVPAGTRVTNHTASGIDKNYHFVKDLAWIDTAYPDYANILKFDVEHYGINVPVEFVDFN